MLEHLVDVVLSITGDPAHQGLRILRAEKNRFGATDEVAVFRMTERGLEVETNPSKLLLADRRPGASGSAVTCFLEGNRPFLVEVQALVTATSYSMPIRRASGIDTNRLLMLLAVLEKRGGLSLAKMDVHVNVVGGLALKDPGTDLALLLALASAATDRPIDAGLLAVGEVGLGGEIRSVAHLERRLSEAAALGFTSTIVPDRARTAPLPATPVRTVLDALTAAGLR